MSVTWQVSGFPVCYSSSVKEDPFRMGRSQEGSLTVSDVRRRTVDDHAEAVVGGISDRVEKESGRSEGLDTLKRYHRDVCRATWLTVKQKQHFGKRVMAGDEQTRQSMIASTLRRVISIGNRDMHRGSLVSDIAEEANLGRIKAVEKCNYKRGCWVSAYAFGWIRQSIERGLINQGTLVCLPVHAVERVTCDIW